MAEESIKVPIDGDTSGFDSAVEGMKGTISAASVAMGNLLADLGKKALSSFSDTISSGDQFNQAINQMAASTGATGAELEGLRDVVKDVYGNNFGESYDDAANAVAEVSKQTGLMGDELQKATESAFALGDTFGYEVNESTRAASALMTNFGVSAEEAYNLIAVGAQNGADQNGDLLDTLNEYSAQYAALGLSADQFTQSLISGAESGAFSIDKVGDAVKGFNIRAKDGSDTSAEAFALIGMNAEDMTAKFAAGGDTAQEAFFQVVQALDAMEDPVAKNTAAVGLFGTQYEDLEANLLPMLASMEDASGTAYDALGQINEVKYDDVGSAMEGLKRTIGSATLDIRSNLSSGLADAIGGFVNTLKTADGDTGKIFDGLVEAGKTALSTIQPVIEGWVDTGKEILVKLVEGIQENLPLIQEKAIEILQFLINGMVSKANMLVEIGLPLLQSLIQGISGNIEPLIEAAQTLLTGLITAIQEAFPLLLGIGQELLTTIVTAIVEALPVLLPLAVQLITTLINGLSEALVMLMEYVPQIILTIVNVIVENLPLLLNAALEILMAVVNGIIDNLPMLIDAAVEMIFTLVDGLIEMLPELIDAALQIITALFEGLIENLPKIIEAGIQLIIALIGGLIEAIPDLIAAIPEIISAIWDALTEVDWLSLGVDILKGIANGLLEGVSAIWDTIKEVAGKILDGFKDFFGINSPSKLMRDTIGQYLLPGVAVGMEDTTGDTADDVNRALDSMLDQVDTDKLQLRMNAAMQMQASTSLGTAAPQMQYNSAAVSTEDMWSSMPSGGGDIIIPVYVGGTHLETVVVKSAQIANARSGGEVL